MTLNENQLKKIIKPILNGEYSIMINHDNNETQITIKKEINDFISINTTVKIHPECDEDCIKLIVKKGIEKIENFFFK